VPIYHKGRSLITRLREKSIARLKVDLRNPNGGVRAKVLRKWIWTMDRSYRPTALRKTDGSAEFNDILARVAMGAHITAADILPYLSVESRDQRCEVNAMLADAYAQGATEEHLQQARIFMQRAWLLSGGSAALLPLYSRISAAFHDGASMREAYKRLGMKAAAQKNVSEAIHYFTKSQNAYAILNLLDKFEYDFDILNCMDELAAPNRFYATNHATLPADGKIRLAHLVKGTTEWNSILVAIDLVLARFYDKSLFDVTFFIPESLQEIEKSLKGKDHIRRFESFGCRVVTGSNFGTQEEILLELAGRIHESQPHILVTSAALADYRHYFITSLRPAPISIGLVQGPPAQFAPPILDWCIAWTKHPLMDCPVDCSWVEIKLDYPCQDLGKAYDRAKLLVPPDACVLMSGGRHPKFQSREFWQGIADLLSQHPEAYFVAVGPREDEIPFLGDILPPEIRARVRCLGWRNDFLNILPNADILLDTYPNGGGQVIVQAMALGIPLVAHHNDYMKLFDQTEWSPVGDFITDPEIVVPRGDFAQFKRVVSRLITDREYRRKVGERCRAEHIRQADPMAAVRRCEEIYLRVLEQFSSAGVAT
jgi:glycosyltransferase involved in cell wall biosynthesis